MCSFLSQYVGELSALIILFQRAIHPLFIEVGVFSQIMDKYTCDILNIALCSRKPSYLWFSSSRDELGRFL